MVLKSMKGSCKHLCKAFWSKNYQSNNTNQECLRSTNSKYGCSDYLQGEKAQSSSFLTNEEPLLLLFKSTALAASPGNSCLSTVVVASISGLQHA